MSSIALEEELGDLASMLEDFCRKEVDDTLIHSIVDAEVQSIPDVFKNLVELGVVGLALPEEAGGSAAGVMGLATAAEALGKYLVPGPVLTSSITAIVLYHGGHGDVAEALVDGRKIGATGFDAGDITISADNTISGRTGPIITGGPVDYLVLPISAETGRKWVVVSTADVEVQEYPSYDRTRRLSIFTFLEPTAVKVLNVHEDFPKHIGAVVLGAEAVGIADWCTRTAAEYAKDREQFGRPIGQFQGVKHRIARMFVAVEQARSVVWDAARCLDTLIETHQPTMQQRDEAALVASAVGAICVDAGFQATKDLINTLGGIGFTWEHMAGFYMRRSQTSSLALGSSTYWNTQVGKLALKGANRQAAVELPEEADAIRAGIRTELDEIAKLPSNEQLTALAEHGYTMPTLPEPWGKNADALTQIVIAEELKASKMQPHDMIIGNWVVPSIVKFGTEEQIERFVRPSLRGEIQWCQLFSEPGAGSDLAGLSTRAEKVEGGWVVNGQKVWTSGAHESDWGILLARTDQTAAKHKGIGYFLLDMASEGITIRPLRELTGEALFNEVFLDNVFIPDDQLLGHPTQGWMIAVNTLANERVHMTSDSVFGKGEEELLEAVKQAGQAEESIAQYEIGKLLCRSLSLSLLGLRGNLKSMAGVQPGAESSVAKLISTQNIQDVWETVLNYSGLPALTSDYVRDNLSAEQKTSIPAHMFLNSRSSTIAGGTTDVQLNIIAERLLGLPRD